MTHFLQCCCYVLEVAVLVNAFPVLQHCNSGVLMQHPLQVQGFSFVTENSLKQLITFCFEKI